MELTEKKRELNNILFRKYSSTGDAKEKQKYLCELVNNNLDFVSYVLYKEYPNHKGYIKEGINGLIIAIMNYEMDKMCSFEEYVLSNIRNQLNNEQNQKKR